MDMVSAVTTLSVAAIVLLIIGVVIELSTEVITLIGIRVGFIRGVIGFVMPHLTRTCRQRWLTASGPIG